MRLKTFTAATTREAMDLVRDELGELAVIVSSQAIPETGETWVTAAINPEDEKQSDHQQPAKGIGAVVRALNEHGAPLSLTDRLTDVMHDVAGEDPQHLLASALPSLLGFSPIAEELKRPILLAGPPGSGKTIIAAKLAARERLAGRTVSLATTDTVRAGGAAQLSVFAGILNAEFAVADSKTALSKLMEDGATARPTLIDTQGVNPFDPAALGELAGLAEAARAEPVLVLAAGGDAQDSGEIAAAFAGIGAKRMIATRLDCARRLGGLLAAAASPLALAAISLTPTIADGLELAEPGLLAALLLRNFGMSPHNSIAASPPHEVIQ